MIKAINKKHQAKVNRAINWLIKYAANNDLRNAADELGSEKLYNKYDRICINAFDKYLEIIGELPKGEVTKIEKSKYY